MASLDYQLRVSKITAAVLAFGLLMGARSAQAAQTSLAELRLEVPNGSVNSFGLELVLDALFNPYRAVPGKDAIDLSGVLRTALVWRREEGSPPQIVGISLQGTPADLTSTNLGAQFAMPTGQVGLATDSVSGCMESDSSTPVENGEFAREDFRLVLMRGTATVTVPAPKPGKDQEIDKVNIVGVFPTADELVGRLNVAHVSGPRYEVTLGIPMAGLSMTIAKAGLPVDLTFNSGELRATGVVDFTVVPEPAAPVLLALALGGCQFLRRELRAFRRSGRFALDQTATPESVSRTS